MYIYIYMYICIYMYVYIHVYYINNVMKYQHGTHKELCSNVKKVGVVYVYVHEYCINTVMEYQHATNVTKNFEAISKRTRFSNILKGSGP